MGGFFGQALGSLLGSAQGAQGLPGILTQVLGATEGGTGGGLPMLISTLENAGLGAHVQSWIGGGENMPVSAEQIASAFPAEKLQAWAQQAGTTPEALSQILAQALPHAVDHATPDGQVPAEGTPVPDLAGVVARLFGGH